MAPRIIKIPTMQEARDIYPQNPNWSVLHKLVRDLGEGPAAFKYCQIAFSEGNISLLEIHACGDCIAKII
jgi:hypothetical protein